MILSTQHKPGAGRHSVPLYFMCLTCLAHSNCTGDDSLHCCGGCLLFGDFLLWLYYLNDVKGKKKETLVLVWLKMCSVSFHFKKTTEFFFWSYLTRVVC